VTRRPRQLAAATGVALLSAALALVAGCAARAEYPAYVLGHAQRESAATPPVDTAPADTASARPGRATDPQRPAPAAEPAPPASTAALPPRSPVPPRDDARRERFGEAYRLMVKGQFAQAEAKLVALVQQTEDAGASDGLDEMLFWLAHCREQQGRSAEAAQTYRVMLRRFPSSSFAADARERADALSPRPSGP
jgi:TolA-binding protein